VKIVAVVATMQTVVAPAHQTTPVQTMKEASILRVPIQVMIRIVAHLTSGLLLLETPVVLGLARRNHLQAQQRVGNIFCMKKRKGRALLFLI
jgi:hypothetical protein